MDQMGGALGVVVPPEAAMLFGCVAASVAHPCLPDAMFALGCHGDRERSGVLSARRTGRAGGVAPLGYAKARPSYSRSVP